MRLARGCDSNGRYAPDVIREPRIAEVIHDTAKGTDGDLTRDPLVTECVTATSRTAFAD